MQKMIFIVAVLFAQGAIHGQTFTMGNKCYEQNKNGLNLLKEKKYQDALNAFTSMEKSCTTKDAKEAIATGKAEAFNGLGKYNEAIAASNAALKVSKNKSLMGYYQKAIAQNKLKQYDASRASFAKVIELTEKNKDKKARASNYAAMSALYWRQMNDKDSANYFLDKATALDPSNPRFVIQRGDMFVDQKDYDQAFVHYDKAMAMGKTDAEMYTIRSNARIKSMQEKYHTINAQELRAKMTPKERELVCTDLKKAISLGLKDMKQEMFASLVCK